MRIIAAPVRAAPSKPVRPSGSSRTSAGSKCRGSERGPGCFARRSLGMGLCSNQHEAGDRTGRVGKERGRGANCPRETMHTGRPDRAPPPGGQAGKAADFLRLAPVKKLVCGGLGSLEKRRRFVLQCARGRGLEPKFLRPSTGRPAVLARRFRSLPNRFSGGGCCKHRGTKSSTSRSK